MSRENTIRQIHDLGVVAVIRLQDANRLSRVVEAIRSGGVKAIEITMTVPNATAMIRSLTASLPSDVLLGAGTVTNPKAAEEVINAGAQFVVSPVLNLDMIKVCNAADIAVLPGCFTPTEIFSAWDAGADAIKIFPATSLGPKFLKDIAGPFPYIKMMPTGGVTIENVGEWIAAGAFAVGMGSALLDKKAIEQGNYAILTELSSRLHSNFRMAAETYRKR
ncbi:MAG: bifunctional 4-hydroxy-2-oxoglutarate aldolase/2-dehydro-3-deoxy-phosphogluconate aldolase [Acidobacteria bacterium]|nr:bifunctional 4-hydroxy-2-oxoglutarate aldolase/2-dehydro-3-deoxy-phosphogluconate aldolase [Acidobacteriota bacterium]